MDPATPRAGVTSPPGWLNEASFRLFRIFTRLFLRLFFGLRVEGELPRTGPVVVAANHTSFLDPLLVGAASGRRVFFLMTEVVWRSPRLNWFYRWQKTLPLSTRGANRDSLRAARQILQRGAVVGIFPEGGISRDGRLLLGSPGAVSLVLSEGAPIVPAGIVGAQHAMPFGARRPRLFHPITVRFGAPITAAEFDAAARGDRRHRLQLATARIMERIGELTGQESREVELRRLRPAD